MFQKFILKLNMKRHISSICKGIALQTVAHFSNWWRNYIG